MWQMKCHKQTIESANNDQSEFWTVSTNAKTCFYPLILKDLPIVFLNADF